MFLVTLQFQTIYLFKYFYICSSTIYLFKYYIFVQVLLYLFKYYIFVPAREEKVFGKIVDCIFVLLVKVDPVLLRKEYNLQLSFLNNFGFRFFFVLFSVLIHLGGFLKSYSGRH